LNLKARLSDIQAEHEERIAKLSAELEQARKKERPLSEVSGEAASDTGATTEKERRLAINNKLLNDMLSQNKKELEELREKVKSLETDVAGAEKHADNIV